MVQFTAFGKTFSRPIIGALSIVVVGVVMATVNDFQVRSTQRACAVGNTSTPQAPPRPDKYGWTHLCADEHVCHSLVPNPRGGRAVEHGLDFSATVDEHH